MSKFTNGEFALINWMRQSCSCRRDVKIGIGDDTAVLPFSAQEDMLLTTDMSVEGTHFTSGTRPELIGRKALARNLSDIAAMGGTPTYGVISLGLPRVKTQTFVKKIYSGINKLAQEYRVSIVGGDTVKSEKLVINIALLGRVAKGRAILRSGAKPGDSIYVTGPVGGSLKSGRHLTFTPRLKESGVIRKYRPNAMIDISDGLAGDLGHILKESGVGAILDEKCIPLNQGASLREGLYDGEDFELLFTLSSDVARRRRPTFFNRIGEIIWEKNKLYLRGKDGRTRKLTPRGFTHF